MKKKTVKKVTKKNVVKGSFTRNGLPVGKGVVDNLRVTTNDDIMDDVCEGLSDLAARESGWTTPCNVASLPEHPRPLKIKTSRVQIDNNGVKIDTTGCIKTSDPEWFANWKPKPEPVLTDKDRDEVLTEFARIIEARPLSVMENLERDVANKTQYFLSAKRALLESKQKLSLAYDKYIKTVKLDKDPLIDEVK